jgi:hypothetical protein
MTNILKKFYPLIQAELGGIENRRKVIELLRKLNYEPYFLQNGTFISLTAEKSAGINCDFYFIPCNG